MLSGNETLGGGSCECSSWVLEVQAAQRAPLPGHLRTHLVFHSCHLVTWLHYTRATGSLPILRAWRAACLLPLGVDWISLTSVFSRARGRSSLQNNSGEGCESAGFLRENSLGSSREPGGEGERLVS